MPDLGLAKGMRVLADLQLLDAWVVRGFDLLILGQGIFEQLRGLQV